jgi:F-type H+-transporting ATPase subunit b
MIWTVLTFLVLLAVLRKLAWKPLLEALDSREKRIDDALLKAEKAQREAEQAIAENRKRSDEAMRQAEQLIDQARKDAEQTRHKMIEEARAESRRVVEQDMRRLEAEQRAAMHEMRSIAADLAIRAAGRLIQSSMTEQQQREIVDQFLKEVRQETLN